MKQPTNIKKKKKQALRDLLKDRAAHLNTAHGNGKGDEALIVSYKNKESDEQKGQRIQLTKAMLKGAE